MPTPPPRGKSRKTLLGVANGAPAFSFGLMIKVRLLTFSMLLHLVCQRIFIPTWIRNLISLRIRTLSPSLVSTLHVRLFVEMISEIESSFGISEERGSICTVSRVMFFRYRFDIKITFCFLYWSNLCYSRGEGRSPSPSNPPLNILNSEFRHQVVTSNVPFSIV